MITDVQAPTALLRDVLARLEAAYDYDTWHWQADTPADYICISAVLVQHTNWSNVERALERLDGAGALSLAAIASLSESELAVFVRPAGTPVTKARRLRALANLATEHGGLDSLLDLPQDALRERLLATHGLGPETADALLLYAAGRPVFVVDAYAQRLFRRLAAGPSDDRYGSWQRWFQNTLLPDVETFRRYHGLIVLHGKETCRPRPRCWDCCLLEMCPTGQENAKEVAETPTGRL